MTVNLLGSVLHGQCTKVTVAEPETHHEKYKKSIMIEQHRRGAGLSVAKCEEGWEDPSREDTHEQSERVFLGWNVDVSSQRSSQPIREVEEEETSDRSEKCLCGTTTSPYNHSQIGSK